MVEVCRRNNFPKADRFIQQGLKQGRLLLLFDGLDEVSSNVRPHAVQCIKDFLKQYQKCRVIITCRSAVYRNEFYQQVDQTLEIQEFQDRQIRRFLQAWKMEMPPDKSVEQLIRTLRDRPKIMALARNPLLLTIIAYLYSDTAFVLPHSRAEFYTKSTNILLELRDQAKNLPNHYNAVKKRRILQHLALYSQIIATEQTEDRRSIKVEAVREQVKKILPTLDLKSEDTDKILNEIVERSGLLLKLDGGERYQFTHLTLQEYFTAAGLSDQPQRLLESWQQSPDNWREVVKLWCGLTSDSSQLIKQIFETAPLTGFECLADAQEVKPQIAQKIINFYQSQLKTASENDLAAFSLVAADISRNRGKSLFEFLVGKLEDSAGSSERGKVVQALSLTNLPQAAESLTHYYTSDDSDVRQSLIRMGELAISPLVGLAEEGQVSAIDDIREIGTPEAADALVPFLWGNDLSVSSSAAWSLGELLQQPEIEEQLKIVLSNC